MSDRFDVVVIGAGPAGAAAARHAADLGLRVALVDRAAFPRDKLCGGGVTGRAAAALRDVFGLEVTADLFRTTARVRLQAGARVLGRIEDAPALHMTRRRAFDARLQALACAAGAVAMARARPVAFDPAGGLVTLDDGRRLSYGVLIGADGVASSVARHLFGRAYDPATIAFALEVELPGRPDDWVEIDFAAAAWGYGWAFPKADGLTLGVGGLHRANPDLRARLGAYLARHGAGADRPEALRCKGAFLPAGDVRAVPGRGAVLLAGDAAGLVDPMTGEGIGHAIVSGKLAAAAAAAALAKGRPERALDHYARALAPLQDEIRFACRLQRLVYGPWTHAPTMALIAARPALQRRALALLAGEVSYAELRRGFLRRLARHAAAALRAPRGARPGRGPA
ncbi:MAG: geranylgeranyl reductase family protein [Alkalilacustris sp.]